MKKMRLHIFVAMGIFLVMIIVGSFLDLQIDQAIFSKNNGFGITVAALSMVVGYGVLAAMGGVFLYHGLKIAKATWQKVLFIVASVLVLGLTVFFCARKEFFGVNGWDIPNLLWLGYVLATPLMGASMFGGYYLASKANNPRLWLLILVAAAFAALALLLGTTAVKGIFNRPRYRILVSEHPNLFYNWWERCTNSKDLMEQYNVGTEEFKSFPSGHAAVSALTMFGVVIFPFVSGKELKNQVIYFYIGLAYTLFVAFTRLLVGAHYLSDVGMGALITTLCLYGFYEIALHYPHLYELPSNEGTEEQPQE